MLIDLDDYSSATREKILRLIGREDNLPTEKKQAKMSKSPLASDALKVEYIRKFLPDIDALFLSNVLLRQDSEELKPLIDFGKNETHAYKIGFKVPIVSRDRNSQELKDNSIRYLRKIALMFGYTLERQKHSVDGKYCNFYGFVRKLD
ncbi:MAG: hypothetical protein DI617_09125 [Streptococcus pyogenes]|nr:MAG: hypothetical protein DI617_09125 [Streptococcus pyogenes]